MSMAHLPTLQDLLEEQMACLQQANMSASAAALEAQLSSLAALLSSLQQLLDTLLSCQALWQRNVLAVSAADAGRHLLPRASVAQVLCRASVAMYAYSAALYTMCISCIWSHAHV